MAEPYVGEIRSVGFNFAPVGWLLCDGSVQSISVYEVLYTLLGTTYGGDGVTTFGLPDLRGRMPIGQGQGTGLSLYTVGQMAGVEAVTITQTTMPTHTHSVVASTTPANAAVPANATLAAGVDATVSDTVINQYLPDSVTVTLAPLSPTTLTAVGGSQPHENRAPFVTANYIIATQGIYPSAQ